MIIITPLLVTVIKLCTYASMTSLFLFYLWKINYNIICISYIFYLLLFIFIWYYSFYRNCFLNGVFSVNIEIIMFLLYLLYFPQNYEWNSLYFPGFYGMVTITSSYEYRKHNNPKPWSIQLLLCVPRTLVPIAKSIITLWKWCIISGSKYCFR